MVIEMFLQLFKRTKVLVFIVFLGNFFSLYALAQEVLPGQIPANSLLDRHAHYEDELLLDQCSDEDAWDNVSRGMHASFGSTDNLYFRREVPNQDIQDAQSIVVWKGERANFQLLIWSPDTLEQVRIIKYNLNDARGNIIPADKIHTYLVRYVVADYPYGYQQASCGRSPFDKCYLMPDRFEQFERFDLPGRTTRPIWISVDVPQNTAPGTYYGKVEVRAKGSRAIERDYKIVVQNQELPLPKDWKYRLDLWQNPWAVAWYNHVEPWSEEHIALLKQHLKPYAEAGGKYITTYGVHSPWSNNSYMIEGEMIKWIMCKDGSWKFDYTIFDKYVETAMACGINKAITVYTAIPWGFRFRYLDEETGDFIYASWPPSSIEFKNNWNAFLDSLHSHLDSKGWFDMTYIGINENPMDETLAAAKATKENCKDWKITYAGNWHEELDELIDDISFLYGNEPNEQQLKNRKNRGSSSTFYVCCNPPMPNNFLFSPPIEGRWISWYSKAKGYDGFLRWAYDAWPEDVLRDGRHVFWPSGDCFMIYPGGMSCIRFEKLREGISDYEKISILEQKIKQSDNSEAKSLMNSLNQLLEKVEAEKKFDSGQLSSDIKEGNRIIQELSNLL
jgi:hypothetical protein